MRGKEMGVLMFQRSFVFMTESCGCHGLPQRGEDTARLLRFLIHVTEDRRDAWYLFYRSADFLICCIADL